MNPLVSWAIAAILLSTSLLAGWAVSGTAPAFVTELEAATFHDVPDALHSNPESWRGAVKAANLALNQSLAGSLWRRERVRLKFANGAWIEFQPTLASIAADAPPRILAIQFSALAKSKFPLQ